MSTYQKQEATEVIKKPFLSLGHDGYTVIENGDRTKISLEDAQKLVKTSTPWPENHDTARRAILLNNEPALILGGFAVVGCQMDAETYGDLARTRGWLKASSFDVNSLLA